MGVLVPSPQFSCKPEVALKIKVYLKTQKVKEHLNQAIQENTCCRGWGE